MRSLVSKKLYYYATIALEVWYLIRVMDFHSRVKTTID